MPYVEGRTVHDADSHVMETPDWLARYADPGVRERLEPLRLAGSKQGEEQRIEELRLRHRDPAERAEAEAELMLRKNWSALGSFLKEDRPRALDLLGVASQLVFNTFLSDFFVRAEHGGDPDLAYGAARAHNRAIVDFCSVDRRLLPVGFVPLVDFAHARAAAVEAVGLGCKAVLVSSACPPGHSPSHVGLFGVWEVVEEAGLPIVFHVGGGGRLIDPAYFKNGRPPVPDFHGGAENFRSIDFMAIPNPPCQTLSAMIFDGVFDRFPRLKVGVIEQGAVWVPSWMRQLDTALASFARGEERLRRLRLKPSEVVKRQIRVTPYPAEPVGWIIEQAGEEICMFSTDFPHVEGGRNPVKRFEESMRGVSERARDRFYRGNFEDLMGSALS